MKTSSTSQIKTKKNLLCVVLLLCCLLIKTALLVASTLGREKDGDDEPIETKRLREDEDEHHGNVHAGLLGGGTDTTVTNNADGHASTETRETHRETAAKVKERSEESVTSLDYNNIEKLE